MSGSHCRLRAQLRTNDGCDYELSCALCSEIGYEPSELEFSMAYVQALTKTSEDNLKLQTKCVRYVPHVQELIPDSETCKFDKGKHMLSRDNVLVTL